jgi:uncharacterized protein YukE
VSEELLGSSPTVSMQAGVRMLDPAISAVEAAQRGDWLGASLSGLATTVDVVSYAIDPIGELLASAASFLMEHVHPLPEMLDSLAGDPGEVQMFAETWFNVSRRLTDVAEQYTTAQRGTGTDWTGAAADSYRTFADTFAEELRAVADICRGTGDALSVASGVVAAVRGIVRDLIADLVAKLIAWVAQVACTVGIGASWVVPQACTAVTKWVTRVSEWLKDLTTAMDELATLVETVGTGVAGTNRAAAEVVTLLRSKPRLDLPSLPDLPMPRPPWESPEFVPDMIPKTQDTFGIGGDMQNQADGSKEAGR